MNKQKKIHAVFFGKPYVYDNQNHEFSHQLDPINHKFR